MADESCMPGTFSFFLVQPRGNYSGMTTGKFLSIFFTGTPWLWIKPPHLASPYLTCPLLGHAFGNWHITISNILDVQSQYHLFPSCQSILFTSPLFSSTPPLPPLPP